MARRSSSRRKFSAALALVCGLTLAVRVHTETLVVDPSGGTLGNACNAIIQKHTFSAPKDTKKLFTWLHLFLFDNLNEPVRYVLNIPYEQFCKYYEIPKQKRASRMLYSIRNVYGLYRLLFKK